MSQNQKPMVGARIPDSWKRQIDELCQETGKSPSAIVQEAIGQYLDRTDLESVQTMNQRLAALERKYQKLAALVTN